jgi:hypothetical protein
VAKWARNFYEIAEERSPMTWGGLFVGRNYDKYHWMSYERNLDSRAEKSHENYDI